MKVQEYTPHDELVKKFVSKYQIFEVEGPFIAKAIPSGTSECWFALEGRFKLYNPQTQKFELLGESGFFPMSGKGYTYYVQEYLRCLNIKLKPTILGLPVFSDFIQNWQTTPIHVFLGENGSSEIQKLDFAKADQVAESLDRLILGRNNLAQVDPKIEQVLSSIFSPENLDLKIGELARMNSLTVKSFERLIYKLCGMTPKKLLNIVRFGKSSSYLKSHEEAQFIDALAFGYYDQSHFIKECKRITKLNPTDFLSRLELHVPDLLVEREGLNGE
ncbi:MAG: helix-turn-helix domain-containing protein [Bacteroidota bacterium]